MDVEVEEEREVEGVAERNGGREREAVVTKVRWGLLSCAEPFAGVARKLTNWDCVKDDMLSLFCLSGGPHGCAGRIEAYF